MVSRRVEAMVSHIPSRPDTPGTALHRASDARWRWRAGLLDGHGGHDVAVAPDFRRRQEKAYLLKYCEW